MTGSYDSDGGGLSYSDDEGERQIVWPSPMAEASKLGGAPADDRAALDDIPMYIHRMFGEHVDEAVMDFPVEPSPAPPPPLKSEDDTASEVAYVDTDGDAIVFSLKANGKLDYFVNGAPKVTDLTLLWFDCGTLNLDGTSAGSWRSTRGTTPQNYAAARRVMSLYSVSYHPPLYGWQRPRHFCDDAVIDFPVSAVVTHLSADDAVVRPDGVPMVSADGDLIDDGEGCACEYPSWCCGSYVDDWATYVDDWWPNGVVDGELLSSDDDPLGSPTPGWGDDTLPANGHMAGDVRKAGVSVGTPVWEDTFEGPPHTRTPTTGTPAYWEPYAHYSLGEYLVNIVSGRGTAQNWEPTLGKAKSAREEAEASKLGGAPADDRAAIDDTNAAPWYQRRLPLTEPKAWMIFGMAFFGMPLVGLCALGISLSLLAKIFLLARGILDKEVLPEAESSKKTLAGGEGKGAPSSA